MSKKKSSNPKSICCGARVKYKESSGRIFNECTKCHLPCKIYYNIRRIWAINPQTKIKQGKKKIFTQKEQNELRMLEDY